MALAIAWSAEERMIEDAEMRHGGVSIGGKRNMGETTGISWTDSTFNPWMSCTKVSPACDNCYAETLVTRRFGLKWGPGAPRKRTSAANWKKPLQWEKNSHKFQVEHGHRQRVFCASLADVFDNEVPDQWRAELFDLIRATPHLDWLLLTKRIGNVRKMLPEGWDRDTALRNVWLGISVVTQEEADRDIPKLVQIPAQVRFLSCEPLLEKICLKNHLILSTRHRWNCEYVLETLGSCTCHAAHGGIDWVIAGGESGPGARPMDQDWVRHLLRDCHAGLGVKFFMKQGSQANWHDFKNIKAWPPEVRVQEWP